MPTVLLQAIDTLLYTIHVVVIVINLFGWILKKTRKLQLITILATTVSWFIVGICYGWGYCFLTDWEWEIKRKLGESGLPNSFIHYLINNNLGLEVDTGILDSLTLWLFLAAMALSFILNWKDFRTKVSQKRS